jgi:transposase
MTIKRKTYSEEFKVEALRLYKESGNYCATARDLGIDHSLIRKWKRSMDSGVAEPFPGKGHPEGGEVAILQRELARLREDNEILKKAVGIFSKSPK